MNQHIESTYAIGDLQGCLESLNNLLIKLPEDCRLLFIGDLVNRGPQSLATLRRVKELAESGRARVVLGNHDLHLLACAAGHGKPSRKDTIGEILDAPDRDELIDWLRSQPLLIDTPNMIFVHAGIPPTWSLKRAKRLAKEAQDKLSGPKWKRYLKHMYGNDVYYAGIRGGARRRAIFNGLTRMRFIDSNGLLEFACKGGPNAAPEGLLPWFELPRKVNKTICFGHWSLAGLQSSNNTVCIDTGALWGNKLTALNIETMELVQEDCPMWADPKHFG